jgi:hypothetical protein
MTVDFNNLEPVVDLVPGTLTVDGTDTDNEIDYRAEGANGLVSVDEFETIEFNNKTDVTLNGNAGSDRFHIAPVNAGFTGTLFINGDEPVLDGDVLTVTGALATATINHTGNDEGTITGVLPTSTLEYDLIESLIVNVPAVTLNLAMTGSADYTVNPGEETDQGEVLSSGVPVTFDGLGAGENLNLTGTGGGTVTANGTNANDQITVGVGAANRIVIIGRANYNATTLPNAVINAFDGHDTFSVTGGHAFTGNLDLHGGGEDDDDFAFLNAATGPVTVNLNNATPVPFVGSVTGFGGTIRYSGLEELTADANDNNLTAITTAGDDLTVVTPGTQWRELRAEFKTMPSTRC